MIVTIDETVCTVQREKGDRAFYGQAGSAYGGGESNLLHHVKQKLNACGYDFIKKRMWRDGHLVDDMLQYLRARNPKKLHAGEVFCIHDTRYAIRDSAEEYNHWEEVSFTVTYA